MVKMLYFSIFILFFLCAGLSAQSTADEMEMLLGSNTITWAQSARFVLQASDVLVTENQEDAFWYAATRGWLPKNAQPEDTARLDGIALLLMRSFNIQGGVMYSITGSPHYAFRELVYRDVIQGRADPYMRISGEQLVFFTGRLLAEREREDLNAAKFAEDRMAIDKKDKLEPDSFDFGILFDQYAAGYRYPEEDRDNSFEYTASLTPRVSFLLGDVGSFYTSLGFTVGYEGEFYHVPELLRTDFSLRFGRLGFRVGRFHYSDPMGFVADSLFDGIQVTHNSPKGRFGFGTWYTGALYKKNANIIMLERDQRIYDEPVVKGEFFDTYFAPRRLLASVDWEHPSLGDLVQINTALSFQYDLTKVDFSQIDFTKLDLSAIEDNNIYHSLYYSLKIGVPVSNFLFIAGGAFETFLTFDENAINQFQSRSRARSSRSGSTSMVMTILSYLDVALAAELVMYYTLPSSRYDGVFSLTGRYASGNDSGPFSVYTPVTTKWYGDIFQTKLSGFSMLELSYSTRFLNTLGASITGSYFIRNDLKASPGSLLGSIGNDKKMLGGEVLGRLIFSPFSDVQYNLGIGAFIPALGNNWPGSKSIWMLSLTTVIGLY